MKDLITHVPSLTDMLTEAIALQDEKGNPLTSYFTIDEDGQGATFNVAKVPVIYSSNGETLCLIRGIPREVVESSLSIKVLGECENNEYVFDSDDCKATYERLHDITPQTIYDEHGVESTYTPPYKIGVFA